MNEKSEDLISIQNNSRNIVRLVPGSGEEQHRRRAFTKSDPWRQPAQTRAAGEQINNR